MPNLFKRMLGATPANNSDSDAFLVAGYAAPVDAEDCPVGSDRSGDLDPTIEIARPVFGDGPVQKRDSGEDGPFHTSESEDTQASVDPTIEMPVAPVVSEVLTSTVSFPEPEDHPV